MSKKVLIISTSLRKNGNSDILAQSFAKGAAEAGVVVWATPIYYYEMTGQMKTMIDRANALFVKDYQFRDVYMLSAAAEEDESACERAVHGLKGWIACFPKSRFAGSVFAGGVTDKGDIADHKALDEAYEMGRNV